jgi:hypothetical protein
MTPYWEYLRWAGYVVAALGAWRFVPLAIVRLAGALTRDEERHKRCMEVLRLARHDAARIPSYSAEYPKVKRQGRPSTARGPAPRNEVLQ